MSEPTAETQRLIDSLDKFNAILEKCKNDLVCLIDDLEENEIKDWLKSKKNNR